MRWISDPSHGWLEVSFRDLADIGAAIEDFSDYSYIACTRGVLYLEEDCDAPRFISRHVGRHSDYFRELPETILPSTRNIVRRCPRLGEIRNQKKKGR